MLGLFATIGVFGAALVSGIHGLIENEEAKERSRQRDAASEIKRNTYYDRKMIERDRSTGDMVNTKCLLDTSGDMIQENANYKSKKYNLFEIIRNISEEERELEYKKARSVPHPPNETVFLYNRRSNGLFLYDRGKDTVIGPYYRDYEGIGRMYVIRRFVIDRRNKKDIECSFYMAVHNKFLKDVLEKKGYSIYNPKDESTWWYRGKTISDFVSDHGTDVSDGMLIRITDRQKELIEEAKAKGKPYPTYGMIKFFMEDFNEAQKNGGYIKTTGCSDHRDYHSRIHVSGCTAADKKVQEAGDYYCNGYAYHA